MLDSARTIWNPMDAENGIEGFFGLATSTIDWCERNYAYTFYCAELFNTLSNIGFISLAAFGIYKNIQQQLPRRFVLAHAGLVLIGVGSFLFHATLQYRFQLGDELPMIWVSTLVTYIVFDLTPIHETSSTFAKVLAVSLTLFNVFFLVAYLNFPNPVFHQVIYGILVVITTIQGARLLYSKSSSLHASKNAEARNLQVIGTILFVAAFTLWNLDNLLCVEISHFKSRIGIFACLLELHALWHLGSGLGCYFVLSAMSFATISARDDPKNYEIQYFGRFLPYINRTKEGWKSLQAGKSEITETTTLLDSTR